MLKHKQWCSETELNFIVIGMLMRVKNKLFDRIPSKQILATLLSSKDHESNDSWSTSSDDEPHSKIEQTNKDEKCKLHYEKFEPNPNVPGLSSQVVLVSEQEVMKGVSKTGTYKNPEYFSYHPMSFYNAESELTCYRLPQPSAFDPLQPNDGC